VKLATRLTVRQLHLLAVFGVLYHDLNLRLVGTVDPDSLGGVVKSQQRLCHTRDISSEPPNTDTVWVGASQPQVHPAQCRWWAKHCDAVRHKIILPPRSRAVSKRVKTGPQQLRHYTNDLDTRGRRDSPLNTVPKFFVVPPVCCAATIFYHALGHNSKLKSSRSRCFWSEILPTARCTNDGADEMVGLGRANSTSVGVCNRDHVLPRICAKPSTADCDGVANSGSLGIDFRNGRENLNHWCHARIEYNTALCLRVFKTRAVENNLQWVQPK
jgi:hypothetical protein